MRDGTYTRSWPTEDGIKTRPCIVRGGRFLQLSDGKWRDLDDVVDLPGVWQFLGAREPGSGSRGVVTL